MSVLSQANVRALIADPGALTRIRLTRARKSLLPFITRTMPEYDVNWHHEIMCNALDRVAAGTVKRLMIFMPPRHGKSEAVSRRWPAHLLGQNPKLKIIAASYGADLASGNNRAVQRIIENADYREIFPGTALGTENIRTVSGNWLRNSDIFEVVGHGGYYRSAGVGGGITGMGCDIGIIDDPIKNHEEADSAVHRERVWNWYTSTFYTRLEKNAAIVILMTRWHEDDLAGRLLDKAAKDPDADKWEVISLPAISEEERAPFDPRAGKGLALWPNKYTVKDLRTIASTVGSRDWNSLYQQRPAPESGGIFKRSHFLYWNRTPDDPSVIEYRNREGALFRLAGADLLRFFTVDLAVSEKTTADYFVVGVWGLSKARKLFLLDLFRDRIEGPDQVNVILRLARTWRPAVVGIEATAYQLSLVQQLARKGLPARPLYVDKDKIARAIPAGVRIETENVFFPQVASYLSDFEQELLFFPNGKNDDQVDVLSSAVNFAATSREAIRFAGKVSDQNTMPAPWKASGT